MKKLITLICFLPVIICTAQQPSNHIFAEGGGQALLYSVNYEHIIVKRIGLRIGYSYFPGLFDTKINSFPASLNYLYSISDQRYIEVGLGFTYNKINQGHSAVSQSLHVGFRHQPNTSGLVFRIGGQLLHIKDKEYPYGYVSWGKVF